MQIDYYFDLYFFSTCLVDNQTFLDQTWMKTKRSPQRLDYNDTRLVSPSPVPPLVSATPLTNSPTQKRFHP